MSTASPSGWRLVTERLAMKRNATLGRRQSFWLLSLVLAGFTAFAQDEDDRKIAPSDTIMIEVFGEKELTKECRVQAGGSIVYPLLKSVQVAGKTTAEVADLIRERLLKEEFLVSPEVSVNVKEYRSRTVSVIGFVLKGGSIELPPEQKMDIIEAISKAGGFDPRASKSKIELTRKGKTTKYKFDELRKETDLNKKIWLEPGDVIYVGESVI